MLRVPSPSCSCSSKSIVSCSFCVVSPVVHSALLQRISPPTIPPRCRRISPNMGPPTTKTKLNTSSERESRSGRPRQDQKDKSTQKETPSQKENPSPHDRTTLQGTSVRHQEQAVQTGCIDDEQHTEEEVVLSNFIVKEITTLQECMRITEKRAQLLETMSKEGPAYRNAQKDWEKRWQAYENAKSEFRTISNDFKNTVTQIRELCEEDAECWEKL